MQAHINGDAESLKRAEHVLAPVEADPNDPALQLALGKLALANRDDDAAIEHLENAVALSPTLVAGHVELAAIHQARGDPQRALSSYQAALRERPDSPELHHNLGLVYLDDAKPLKARACFERALVLRPDFITAKNNLGRTYSARLEFGHAVACFREVLALKPDHVAAGVNLGYALIQAGQYEEALRALETCLRATPNSAPLICAMGYASLSLNRIDDAEGHFRTALVLDPALARGTFGLGNVNLIQGDLVAGWAAYESRTDLPEIQHYYRSSLPRWQGEEIAGKSLVVHSEQGYGDILMFARFLPRLTRRGARVIFRCRGSLVRLMRDSFPTVAVVDMDSDPEERGDFSIPLLSLPFAFGIGIEDLTDGAPYLHASQELRDAWRHKVADRGLRVGIAWGANQLRSNHARRVPEPADYAPLAAVSDVTFYNLSVGADTQEITNFPVPLVDLAPAIHDFADTAGLIENLDLVLSIDTSVAHLAGGLGKRTWLLHSGTCDWRWEIAGVQSPWYPNVRLWRRTDGWQQSLADIARETCRYRTCATDE